MQHTAPTAQCSGPCQHKVNPTNYWSIATINYKQYRLIFLISYTCKCCMRIMERTFAIQETTPVKQRKQRVQGRKDGWKLALVFNMTENKLFCNSHPNFVTILDFKTCTQLLRLVTEFIIFWERLWSLFVSSTLRKCSNFFYNKLRPGVRFSSESQDRKSLLHDRQKPHLFVL